MNKFAGLHPLIWNVIIGTMFGRMATSMSIPFLAIYLTDVKGVSASETGIIIAVSSLVGIATSFFGGYLSDRYGRKIVLLVAVFMWALVFVGFGLVDAVIGFFFMNAMNGFCRSIFEPTSRALLADLTETENRLIIFNLRYTAINVGVIFGPIIGYFLGSSRSTFAFFIAAIVYVLYGLSLILTFYRSDYKNNPRSIQNRVSLKDALLVTKQDSILLWSLIGFILAISGYAQFNSTLPQVLSNSDTIENGAKLFSILLALNATVVITLQYPLLKIGKLYSPLLSIIIGNSITCIGLLGFGLGKGIPLWIVMVVIFTIGEILMFSMTDMFIDSIAREDMRGTYFGAMGFTQFGNVIGPAIGGVLIDYFGYDNQFAIFGFVSLIAMMGIPILIFVKLKMSKTEKLNSQHVVI